MANGMYILTICKAIEMKTKASITVPEGLCYVPIVKNNTCYFHGSVQYHLVRNYHKRAECHYLCDLAYHQLKHTPS